MNACRIVCLCAMLLPAPVLADAPDKKGPKIADKSFRQISSLFLSDPLDKSARDWPRLILLYTLETPDAVVVLGAEELKWVGKDGKYGLPLLAAYVAGNITSQLNSGVKRNDRYAGLLTLFRVYRALRATDKDFKIAEVEDLLALQQEDKLVKYLQKFEDKSPTKLGPTEREVIRQFMGRK